MIDEQNPQLESLSMPALNEAFTLFYAIAKLPPEDRPGAGWGEWWAWRLASEIAQREGVRLITRQPLYVGLDALDDDDLITFAVNFDRVARSNLAGLEQWCTRLVLQLTAEASRRGVERQAEKDDLAHQLADLRAQRAREPYALPDDHGLPPWSVISGTPVDGEV